MYAAVHVTPTTAFNNREYRHNFELVITPAVQYQLT